MPHVPIFVSEEFKGKSRNGVYGDVLLELDWSIGRITEALQETGIRKKTLVIFTGDNGPLISGTDRTPRSTRRLSGTGTENNRRHQ
ncbi:MAG: sulfatase-like hydrolase/transferase [Fuerstiella sp.]|nr:sulfatase-like hydrolase/transferase [Fuerstiella sp.]MCP4853117.1 sulfatase-like hydrolase/transferase [Fuerstiella sp.]